MHPERSYPLLSTPIIVHEFSELDSTNSFLKSHLDTYPAWSAIHARSQTGGRGRADRSWKSLPDKDLAISFAIPLTTLSTDQWPLITLTAGLSVCETLEFFGLRPTIKWPNDLLIDGAKVCGILTETSIGSGHPIAVLGIGINVFSTAGELQVSDKAATSMLDKGLPPKTMNVLIEHLCTTVYRSLDRLLTHGFSDLAPAYNARLDAGKMLRTFIDGSRCFEAYVVAVDDNGALTVTLPSGESELIVSGEISG